MKRLFLTASLFAAAIVPAPAALLITEVHPTGSSNTTYAADWFELTNTDSAPLDITNWRVDDNSNASASALALRGVTTIGPGSSVVFVESNTSGTNDATVQSAFRSAWFGSNVPANFTIGSYGGSSIGLGGGGDAVNIFNGGGTTIARVDFGAATTGVTFDNAAGLNDTTISTLSQAGVNGAFTSVTGGEIGSPGAVPEPGTYACLAAGLLLVGVAGRRRRDKLNAAAE